MRPFVYLLAITLLATPAGRAADPDKPEADTAPVKGRALAVWKIRQVSFSPEGALLFLNEAGTGKSLVLKSDGSGPSRLLSVGFSAESDELRAEVLIDGARHSLVQKTADLASASPRGPTPEDRQRYESLSGPAREKFRDQLRAKFTDPTFRNAPEEERRATVRAIFDKIEKEEKGAPATSANDKKDTYPVKEELELTRALAEEKFEGQRKAYEQLSEKARVKFRDQLREKFSDPKFRDAPEEERRAALRAILEKIEKEDQMPR